MDDPTARAPGSESRYLSALLFAVLPMLYLSINFFGALFRPLAPSNLPWIRDGMLIIWMEFILAHAGIFALGFLGGGIHWRTLPGALLFIVFYGMFIVGFAFAFDRAGMVVAMGALLFGRLYSAAFAKDSSMDRLIAKSFLTLGIYMACMFVSTVLYHGWSAPTNRALANLLGDRHANSFYGQAVAACALYFLALALLELKLYFSPPAKAPAAPAKNPQRSSKKLARSSLALGDPAAGNWERETRGRMTAPWQSLLLEAASAAEVLAVSSPLGACPYVGAKLNWDYAMRQRVIAYLRQVATALGRK